MTGFSELGGVMLRYAGWAVIPPSVTTRLIAPIHKYVLRRPLPQPGTPQFQQAYRYTYAFVIMSYLTFNLVYAAFSQAPNYYQLLGVGLDANDNELKAAFRKFAKWAHPDKVGEQGTPLFTRVRNAYEALRSPIKRFAYDRFGAAAFEFEHCITEDEYLHTGLLHNVGFYIATLFFMVVYGVLGEQDSGVIWRYLLFFYLLFCELVLYYQPFPSESAYSNHIFPMKSATMAFPLPITILRWLFPQWIPFQHVSFLHEVFTAVCIAIARVLPVVWPDKERDDGGKAWVPLVHRLGIMVQSADNEVTQMIQTQFTASQGVPTPAPGAGQASATTPEADTVAKIKQQMENLLVDSTLLNHPMLGQLWRDAVEKRRAEVQSSSGSASSSSRTAPTSLELDLPEERERSPSPLTSPTDTMRRSPSKTPEPPARGTRAVSEPSPSKRRHDSPPAAETGSLVQVKEEEF